MAKDKSFDAGGQMYGSAVTLVSSGTRTTSGSSGSLPIESIHTLRLVSSVTAASGTTPSLTVTLEHSGDGTTWVAHSSFAAQTGTGSARKVFSGFDRYVRITWAITGTTPSFTFSVSGEALD